MLLGSPSVAELLGVKSIAHLIPLDFQYPEEDFRKLESVDLHGGNFTVFPISSGTAISLVVLEVPS